MTYPRTAAQRATDLATGRTVEEQVAAALGPNVISHTNSTNKLDFYMPGGYVEVKGKYQPLSQKFMRHAPEGWDERDCFIIDELSVRKALEHYPEACVLLYDKPCDRWFMAPIDLLVCADRIRLNRTGPTGVTKGKWMINLQHFKPLRNLRRLTATLAEDRCQLRWKQSECITQGAVDIRG